MQLLQLMDGADDIGLVGQTLSGFAKLGLQLKVLLEVVLTGLAVQLEQVIELLHVELVVTPQLVGLLGRHILDFFPFLLQGLEFLIGLVGFLRRGNHAFYLLDDGQFLLQVVGFLGFLFLEELGTLLLDDAHFGLEGFLFRIRSDMVGSQVASCLGICLELGIALGNVQLVEYRFQVVYFVFLQWLVAVSNLRDAVEYLLLGVVHFPLRLFSYKLFSHCFSCFFDYSFCFSYCFSCRLFSHCFSCLFNDCFSCLFDCGFFYYCCFCRSLQFLV